MKKTYISPESFTVRLTMNRPLLLGTSDPRVGINFDDSVDAGEVEVKSVINDVNVWDSTW